MAAAQGSRHITHAARGPSLDSDVARFALSLLLEFCAFLGIESFARDARASTAIEYAMIAAGIAVAIVSAVDLLGQNVYTLFFAKIVAAVT